jgi:lipid II:glycine glycyltransferase (peptidoglycan interpeptide bridge formation enzyme)
MNDIKSIIITLRSYLDQKQLQDFDNCSIYHDKSWLSLIDNAFDYRVEAIQTTMNDNVVALTPYIAKRRGPITICGSPIRGSYTEFIGPILKPNLESKVIEQIILSQHNLLKATNSYIEIGCHYASNLFDFNKCYQDLGYSHNLRSSLDIDISSGVDNTWSSMKSRARNMIRKAEKSAVDVKSITPNSQWIDTYFSMLSETFASQGLHPPHSKNFYTAIADISDNNSVRFVQATSNSQIISAAIFMLDITNSRMVYLSGVSNKEGMNLAASSLIQWHIIKEAINLGVSNYDMGGLGIPSIDKFKKSFGGSQVNHHRWIYRSPMFRVIEPILVYLANKRFLNFN